jgi:hypothetical protein
MLTATRWRWSHNQLATNWSGFTRAKCLTRFDSVPTLRQMPLWVSIRKWSSFLIFFSRLIKRGELTDNSKLILQRVNYLNTLNQSANKVSEILLNEEKDVLSKYLHELWGVQRSWKPSLGEAQGGLSSWNCRGGRWTTLCKYWIRVLLSNYSRSSPSKEMEAKVGIYLYLTRAL